MLATSCTLIACLIYAFDVRSLIQIMRNVTSSTDITMTGGKRR